MGSGIIQSRRGLDPTIVKCLMFLILNGDRLFFLVASVDVLRRDLEWETFMNLLLLIAETFAK